MPHLHNGKEYPLCSEIVKHGFTDAYCETCQKPTIHYLGSGNYDKPHCKACDIRKRAEEGDRNKGSVIVQGSLRNKQPFENPSEREFRRVNRMDMSLWHRDQEERESRVTVKRTAAVTKLFADDSQKQQVPSVDPTKITCKFCGVEVQTTTATSEKKPRIRLKMEAQKDDRDEIQITERVQVIAETIHACKEHALLIRKPIEVRTV